MSLRLQPVNFSTVGWVNTTVDEANQDAGLDSVIASIPLKMLTTESLNGSGAFDVLMRSTKLHLKEEYENQRITGNDYTTVYLGALTAVLQASVQFLMNGQQINKINAEIGLVRQQTVTELANTDDNIPVGLGFNHITEVVTPIPPVDCFSGGIV